MLSKESDHLPGLRLKVGIIPLETKKSWIVFFVRVGKLRQQLAINSLSKLQNEDLQVGKLNLK